MGLTQKLGTIPLAIQTDSSNNVGIGGAANASYKLAVTGATLTTGAATFSSSVTSNASSSTSFYTGTYTSNTLGDGSYATYSARIRENNSYALNFDVYDRTAAGWKTPLTLSNAGNVGIGTSNPLVKLQVTQPNGTTVPTLGTSSGGLFIAGDGNQYGLYIGNDGNTGNSWLQAMRNNTATAYNILLNPVGGNVGIGTSSPNFKLHINNTAANSYMQFTSATTGSTTSDGLIIGSGDNGDAVFLNRESTAMTFYTSNTERMRITSGGDIYINNGAALFYGSGAGTYIVGSTTAITAVVNTGGVKLNSGATSWVSNSDERIKTNLIPIENGLNKVLTLRAVTGRFNTDEENLSRSFLIAQDVQKVLPEAIYEDDDEIKTLGIRYTEVIPLLVAAIKELSSKVTALENK